MSAKARDGLERTPFLRTSNVFWDEIDLSKVDEMEMTARDLEDKTLRAGDLLVCEGGDIGRSAVWDGQVATMSFQNHLFRVRVSDPEQMRPRFLVRALNSSRVRRHWVATANTSAAILRREVIAQPLLAPTMPRLDSMKSYI